MSDLAATVLKAARENDVMISTAESCTGGLVFAELTEVAGSSDVMDRGFVTYSYASKSDLLGVSAQSIRDLGAVSSDVALQMAQGALRNSDASLAVAITGVAGPGASESKPEGLVWFAIARTGASTKAVKREFGALGRSNVRKASVEFALQLLLESLEKTTN